MTLDAGDLLQEIMLQSQWAFCQEPGTKKKQGMAVILEAPVGVAAEKQQQEEEYEPEWEWV